MFSISSGMTSLSLCKDNTFSEILEMIHTYFTLLEKREEECDWATQNAWLRDVCSLVHILPSFVKVEFTVLKRI